MRENGENGGKPPNRESQVMIGGRHRLDRAMWQPALAATTAAGGKATAGTWPRWRSRGRVKTNNLAESIRSLTQRPVRSLVERRHRPIIQLWNDAVSLEAIL